MELPRLPVATVADAADFCALQWACFEPALHEPLDVLAADITSAPTHLLREPDPAHGRLVGAVRTEVVGDACHISLLMVAPDRRGVGLGRALLAYAEAVVPDRVASFHLLVAAERSDNVRRYRRAGYRYDGDATLGGHVLGMWKQR